MAFAAFDGAEVGPNDGGDAVGALELVASAALGSEDGDGDGSGLGGAEEIGAAVGLCATAPASRSSPHDHRMMENRSLPARFTRGADIDPPKLLTYLVLTH